MPRNVLMTKTHDRFQMIAQHMRRRGNTCTFRKRHQCHEYVHTSHTYAHTQDSFARRLCWPLLRFKSFDPWQYAGRFQCENKCLATRITRLFTLSNRFFKAQFIELPSWNYTHASNRLDMRLGQKKKQNQYSQKELPDKAPLTNTAKPAR